LLHRFFRKQYALPAEHGAWIWFLGPYALGVAAGGRLSLPLLWLLLAGLFGFLLRQPVAILVKVHAGRRDRRQLAPAVLWSVVYGSLALVSSLPLILAGYAQLLGLAVPGLMVFGWHLWLIKRRSERHRPGVEVVAAGVLALLAPAAYWVAGGSAIPVATGLWAISWLQAAASIVLIHLRLDQRSWLAGLGRNELLARGRRALAYHAFNLIVAAGSRLFFDVPAWVLAGFGLMLLDCIDAVFRPARGRPPRRIGLRQTVMSSAFILLVAIGFGRWHAAG
jgi:hypothetical protein